MIVPRYWAEAQRRHRDRRRQITVRRFGWSDASQEAAQLHAEQRADEALAQLVAGQQLPRRERKVAYNGAEGLPIREGSGPIDRTAEALARLHDELSGAESGLPIA